MKRVNENNLKKEGWILKVDDYNFPNYLKLFGEYVVKLRPSPFKNKNGVSSFCVDMRIFDITDGNAGIAWFKNIKCMETIDIIVNFLKQQQIVEYKHDDIINNGYTKLFEYEYAKVFKKGLGISIDIEEKQFTIRRSWKYELKVNKQFNFSAMEKLLELCEDDYHQYRNNKKEKNMTKDEEIEQLKDELDALHMTYLSQVSLYKSLYNHLKEKIDSFDDEKIEQIVNDAVGSLDNSYKIFYRQAINEVLNQLKDVKEILK